MSSLFPNATCFPIWQASVCIIQTWAMTEQKHALWSNNYLYYDNYGTCWPFSPNERGKKLFHLVSKWSELPMELTDFQETCNNYTACPVSVLITLAKLHSCCRQSSALLSRRNTCYDSLWGSDGHHKPNSGNRRPLKHKNHLWTHCLKSRCKSERSSQI